MKVFGPMRRHIIIGLVVVGGVLPACNTTDSSEVPGTIEETGSSIYVSEQLTLAPYLASPDDKLTFSDQLTAEWDFGVDVADVQGEGVQSVSNCHKLFQADLEGKEPLRPHEFTPYRRVALQCYAVSLASKIKAPRQHTIGSLVLDKNLAGLLPVEFAFISSVSEKERILNNKQFRYWSDAQKITSVTKVTKQNAIFAVEGGSQEFTLLAQGDFNEDGDEDILLRVTNTVDGGSYSGAILFLLTKGKGEKTFRLLKMHE